MLFNATNAKHTLPTVRPMEEQDERESQRLWYQTNLAIKDRNHDAATDEKSKIEDRQRVETAQRTEKGLEWEPKLFRKVRGGPGGTEEGEEDLDWILSTEMYSDWYLPLRSIQLTCYSDPKADPEVQTKQILAIAPILPGQTAQNLHSAGQISQQQYQRQSPQAQAPPQPQYQQHLQAHQNAPLNTTSDGTSDLISFDRVSTPQPPAANQQTIPQQQNLMHDYGGSVAGLQQPLQPGEPIKRQDTLTKEVEQFVDADEGK